MYLIVVKSPSNTQISQAPFSVMEPIGQWKEFFNSLSRSDPFSPAAAVTTFTPAEAGVYEFQLIVSDGSLQSAPDTVTITVSSLPDVSGTVTSGGVPVPGAVVRIYNDSYSAMTLTDENGHYEFYDVPPGTYYIVATKKGYTLESKTVVAP